MGNGCHYDGRASKKRGRAKRVAKNWRLRFDFFSVAVLAITIVFGYATIRLFMEGEIAFFIPLFYFIPFLTLLVYHTISGLGEENATNEGVKEREENVEATTQEQIPEEAQYPVSGNPNYQRCSLDQYCAEFRSYRLRDKKRFSSLLDTLIEQINETSEQRAILDVLLADVSYAQKSACEDCGKVFYAITEEILVNLGDASRILVLAGVNGGEGVFRQDLLEAEIASNAKKIELLKRLNEQIALQSIHTDNVARDISYECFVEAVERQGALKTESGKAAQIIASGGSAFMAEVEPQSAKKVKAHKKL